MEELRNFSYSVYRFVPDAVRDEGINLGVVVVSDEENNSRGAFNFRFKKRLAALGTESSAEVVRQVIETFCMQLSDAYQPKFLEANDNRMVIRNTENLRTLACNMRNQFQLTNPRPFRAPSMRAAVEELYALLVSPKRKPPVAAKGMSLAQLRVLIRRTIRDWGGDVVRVQEERLQRVRGARHFADFWLETGTPVAAFVAIPEDPGEKYEAWARRDSVPTIAQEFSTEYPNFTAVAVLPPNGHTPTDFVTETTQFLRAKRGVIVAHADELEELKAEIVPQLL